MSKAQGTYGSASPMGVVALMASRSPCSLGLSCMEGSAFYQTPAAQVSLLKKRELTTRLHQELVGVGEASGMSYFSSFFETICLSLFLHFLKQLCLIMQLICLFKLRLALDLDLSQFSNTQLYFEDVLAYPSSSSPFLSQCPHFNSPRGLVQTMFVPSSSPEFCVRKPAPGWVRWLSLTFPCAWKMESVMET